MTRPITALLLCLSVSVSVSVVAGLGEPCSVEVSCKELFTVCIGVSCQCDQGQGYINVSNTCLQVACGELTSPDKGSVSYVENPSRESIEAIYTCHNGFRLEGEASRFCQGDLWSGSAPVCVPISLCSTFADLANGTIQYDPNPPVYNSVASFTCNKGFERIGPASLQCNSDGTWNGDSPVCNPIACPSLVQPVNGFFEISDSEGALNAVVTYSCNDGYILEGSRSRTCTETGQWSGDPPTCKPRSCSTFADLANGTIQYDPNPPVYNSVASFTCNKGFERIGPASLQCNSDGTWNGDSPVCNPIDTGDPTPTTLTSDPTTSATTTTTPPLTCTLNCQNLGSCIIDGNGDSQCECQEGFSGTVCEEEDYCVTKPCPDIAEDCKLITRDRVCICPVGFKGDSCTDDDPIVTCQPNFEKAVYLENSPSTEERSVCLPQGGTTDNDICHNPGERLTYDIESHPDVTTDTDTDQDTFCVKYTGEKPSVPKVCVTVTAFEEDDKIWRPWINDTVDICFVLNNYPSFIDPYEVNVVFESLTSEETKVVSLSVSDQDSHQSLTLAVAGVDPSSMAANFEIVDFTLQVRKSVDMETPSQTVQLSVTVADDGTPALTTTATLTVVLWSVDDLECIVSPFPPLLFHIPDGLPDMLEKLGQVSCPNAGSNSGLTFETRASVGPVRVRDDGTIVYDPDLRSESQPTEGDFSVRVMTSIQQPVAMSRDVFVPIIADDFTADCVQPGNIVFSERAAEGDCFIVLTCSEMASAVETCEGDSQLFDVRCEAGVSSEQTNVKLCVAASLINQFGSLEVPIRVINQYGTASLILTVTIDDVNNPPNILAPGQKTFEVPEKQPAGFVVATLSVTDPDLQQDLSDEELSVTLEEDPSQSTDIPFSAVLNADFSAVVIETTDLLDVQVRTSYQLRITVRDLAGESSSVVLTVVVLDVNETPTCTATTNPASVSVRNKVGDTVTTVRCSDPDPGDVLTFRLQGSDLFTVDDSGVVTVGSSLAGLTELKMLTIFVIVTDRGQLFVNISIDITINSSFPPVCVDLPYTKSLSENTDANVCFDVETNCVDKVDAEQLSYTLISGNGTQYFKLNPDISSSNSLKLCTNVTLKHQYGSYMVFVNVSSSFGAVQVPVMLSVNDVNDPPTFDRSLYRKGVPEDSVVGPMVVVLNATDPDSGVAGTITYFSRDLASSAFFALDTNSGFISIKSPLDADVATQEKKFTFIVEAVDGAPQPLTASTTVEITIIDVNDMAPVCKPASATVRLQLTDPIDTLVFQTDCSDGDLSDKYSRIGYRIKDTSQQVFAVNSTGHVVLMAELAREVTRYTLEVEAYDTDRADDPKFSTLVTITVSVNIVIPPTCNPPSIVQNLRETQPISDCLDKEVICYDPTGGEVTFVSESGTGKEYMETRFSTVKEQLRLNTCIRKSIKNQFGDYQLLAEVTNGLASTTVTWTFTVVNINEAPYFEPKVYETTVNENIEAIEKILAVTVHDPDEAFGEDSFKIISITADLENSEDFDNQLENAVFFVEEQAREFYAIPPMNATIRNLYKYKLRVEDGEGLYDFGTAVIHVRDINSPPICPDVLLSVKIDILAEIGAEVYDTFCYDTDIDPPNIQLAYRITDGDLDKYFNITSDGKVIVAKKFSRTRLYGTASANLSIEVQDHGTPFYVTRINLNVLVNNQIPSECSPVVTPPDKWIINKCATLTMDCTDPTIPGKNDHLSYTYSGSVTQGFDITRQEGGVFKLCYLKTVSGNYEIQVIVQNGLQAKTYTETIVVKYLAATPVFTSTEYKKNVTEDFAADTVIVTVEAVSVELIGSLVYHVIGNLSTKDWDSYFELNGTSGQISTLVQLRGLANQVVKLRIEAEDTDSLLRSATQVQITIFDINEVPECRTTPDLDIDVTAAVGTQVVGFSCSDPDVKPEYKSLTYGLTAGGAQQVFILSPDEEPVSIVTDQELSVTVPSYTLRMSVTDGGTPALVFTKSFTVTVSLLPPPLKVETSELTYESVLVTWSYDRSDFYSVTQAFQVILKTAQGEVIESPVQRAGIRQLNTTGLQAETSYSLVVKATTSYGTRESVPLTFTTLVVPILRPVVYTILVTSEDFTQSHRDPESQRHLELDRRIVEACDNFLQDTPGYAGTHVKGFRPANSVFVDLITFVTQFGSIDDLIDALEKKVNSGWLGGDLSVDSGYFFASAGSGYITIESIGFEPQTVYNGTNAVVTCKILTVGYSETAAFDFYWTYNGNFLQPTSQSRYTITSTTSEAIYENKQSTLQISPILNEHAGVYGCVVSDGDRQQTASSDISITVQSQPRVTLTPRSQTVNQGDPVVLVCEVVGDDDMFSQFVWYKDDVLLQDAPGSAITQGDGNETLTVASIQASAVYGCEGTGPAGSGPRVLSHIGVIPTGPAGNIICGIITEVRNDYRIVWPATAADTIAIEACPSGYIEGEVTRSCDINGQWQTSVFDCRRQSIVQIDNEVNAIQDGTATKNLSTAIDELAEETDQTLLEGDLSVALDTLDTIALIVNDPVEAPDVTVTEAEEDTENYLRIASNLIAQNNKPSWESRLARNQGGAISVPRAVEGFIKGKIDNLSPSGNYFKTFSEDNVYAEVGRGARSVYEFPDRSQAGTPDWLKGTGTHIKIPVESIEAFAPLGYGSSFYRNIPAILETRFIKDGKLESATRHINAETVTFQVFGDIGTLDTPAILSFQHTLLNYSDPQCVSWDDDVQAYVTDGCYVVSTSDEMTECACSHFTNFAILMSPGKTPEAHVMALSIISAIGCALSIFFLLLTIVLHLIVWRLVKSDRAVLLLNLCVALIIAYIFFLVGVGRAENEDVCTAVSLLLHFFYLAVFFLMLAYGIEIGVTIMYVFATSSRIKWLLPLAWGIPLVIVAISAGITKLEGYGNESFCWLSIEDGLLWAFVGPAALVILFNFIIVITVFRKMFKSSAMLTKTDKEKAKAGLRSLCILLPILGLTWVFGIFSVNEDLVVFQYIFAVCNTLQGVFIFLFHCAFNKQLKDAFKQRRIRKKSLESFEKSYAKKDSTTSTTAFYSDISKQNNDSEVTTETTNPFLEADRQMNKLMDKNKAGANLYGNKLKSDKDKKDNAVDLEDVKISNILRESEVMGGTTGISSILQTQSTSLPDTRRVTDDEKGGGLRSSVISSHKYDYIDPSNISKPSASSKYDYVDAASSSKPITAENAVYISTETKNPAGYEGLNQPYTQKLITSTDSLGASNGSSKDRGPENLTDRQKGKIYTGKDKGKKDGSGKSKERDGSGKGATKSQLSKSSKSSRSDEDYEARVLEPYHRKTHVYMPYGHGPSTSAQNISSISTALPTITYDQYQANAKKAESPRKQESSLKKKDKNKKKVPKDRSKAYEYSFETTYLGDRSRHSSLENMNMQQYSPYAQMPGYGTGRPTQPQQHWDQYQYQYPPQPQRQPYYRGDYW